MLTEESARKNFHYNKIQNIWLKCFEILFNLRLFHSLNKKCLPKKELGLRGIDFFLTFSTHSWFPFRWHRAFQVHFDGLEQPSSCEAEDIFGTKTTGTFFFIPVFFGFIFVVIEERWCKCLLQSLPVQILEFNYVIKFLSMF